MRIFKIDGKLAEEIGYYNDGGKIVFYKFVEEKDKDKCPHCHRNLEVTHDIVEGCIIWENTVKPVNTIES